MTRGFHDANFLDWEGGAERAAARDRRKHDTRPWPHEPGCSECHFGLLCNVCGREINRGVGRCTNGRCMDCHGIACTPGGNTSPGHNYGTREDARRAHSQYTKGNNR